MPAELLAERSQDRGARRAGLQVEILRREGSYLLFRHYEFQRYLTDHGEELIT